MKKKNCQATQTSSSSFFVCARMLAGLSNEGTHWCTSYEAAYFSNQPIQLKFQDISDEGGPLGSILQLKLLPRVCRMISAQLYKGQCTIDVYHLEPTGKTKQLLLLLLSVLQLFRNLAQKVDFISNICKCHPLDRRGPR